MYIVVTSVTVNFVVSSQSNNKSEGDSGLRARVAGVRRRLKGINGFEAPVGSDKIRKNAGTLGFAGKKKIKNILTFTRRADISGVS